MSAGCCHHEEKAPSGDPRWRAVLWAALVINGGMFAVELYAGAQADSRALQADALDFFSDAANYALSLGVAGAALVWRARAAMVKGVTLGLLGAVVLASAVQASLTHSAPEPHVMGAVGIAALIANATVTLLLYRYRAGDANMRSVWICSRNDSIANVAVVLAAVGVFGTGTAWPDLIVAAVIAGLALWGAIQIIAQARGELRQARDAGPAHSHG